MYRQNTTVSIYQQKLQTEYSEEEKKAFADVEICVADFTDGITKGFKHGYPYSDVTNSPSV